MPDAILTTVGLTKRYGQRLAVDHLSLEIPAGEIFGFLGPNGSGKSTTIRMMLSLIRPDSGDVFCFGLPVSKSYPGYLKNIGALVEGADFYDNLSALTNLKMLARMHSVVDDQRCLEVLRLVDLESRKDDQVKTFSHGMRQRLGIEQAILHRPKLLILDEPSTGLDPQGMVDMRRMIQGLVSDEGMTVFLSSHMLHEVEQICTSLAVLNEGRLLVSGPVDQFLSPELATLTELQIAPSDR
ncbi:MAG: ATP-binding cassette domain-containing protein, partial [Candidatus Marinimicrobia bacterium]|nr:ATP-binding cassette domain-containing protein [Candidatus Neomarinimicrobiota bacterium]